MSPAAHMRPSYLCVNEVQVSSVSAQVEVRVARALQAQFVSVSALDGRTIHLEKAYIVAQERSGYG